MQPVGETRNFACGKMFSNIRASTTFDHSLIR